MQKRRTPHGFLRFFVGFPCLAPLFDGCKAYSRKGESFSVCVEVAAINFLISRVKIQYNEEKGLKACVLCC